MASVSPESRSFSLLAIQQEEKAFASRVQLPTKSFAEIQEEERDAERSRAEEVEFMRWWQEEEARVTKNPAGNGASQNGGRGRGRGRGRDGQRQVPHRGRGRDAGQGGQSAPLEGGTRGEKAQSAPRHTV